MRRTRGNPPAAICVVAAVIAIMMASQLAVAQPIELTGFRIGIADTQRIFDEYVKTQEANETLDGAITRLESEATSLEDQIRGLEERLTKQRLFIDDDAKVREMEQEIRSTQQDRMHLLELGRVALEEKQKELTEPILKEIRTVIRELGERNGYDMIIEKRLVTLFHRPEMEITDEIVRILNERAAESVPEESPTDEDTGDVESSE